MLSALMHSNNYITRLNMEFNPIKHQILRDIDAQTKLNIFKVYEQEIPMMKGEIIEAKSRTAYLLHECAKDSLLKDQVKYLIGPHTIDILKRLNLKTKVINGRHQQPSQTRVRLEGISKKEQKQLLNGDLFSSADIVQLYQFIGTLHRQIDLQKESLFEQLHVFDEQKAQMMADDKAVFSEFKQEQQRLIEIKRDLDYTIKMLEE